MQSKRRWPVIVAIIFFVLSIFSSVHFAYADTLHHVPQTILHGKPSVGASLATSSIESGPITGNHLFDNPKAPVGNYMFDSNGWLGNLDPVYWLSSILFVSSVSMMFFALNFFKVGYSTHGLNAITVLVLKILHRTYSIAVPFIPLVVLTFIGVFLWFGFLKRDLPAVFGRAVKMGAVFLLIVMLSSPAVVSSQIIQKIGAFPGTIGNFAGGVIEAAVSGATGAKASGTPSLIENAWDDLVLQEWISGEEGQNDNAKGTAVVSPLAKEAAWRQILGYPLQASPRNQVVGILQSTPSGPVAFSSGNRMVVSIAAFVGNVGAILYFLIMGLVMLAARLAFLVLVAAGAVILPLELFPITRATTLTLKWLQAMLMSLFIVFFVSLYSSILFGLSQIITTAIQDSSTFGGSFSSVAFLGQGVVYIAAIYLAWKIYQKLHPMQRIKTMTEKAAKRGVSLGWGQRLTAGARRSSPWETRSLTRKSLKGDARTSSSARRPADVAESRKAREHDDEQPPFSSFESGFSQDDDPPAPSGTGGVNPEAPRGPQDHNVWSETIFEPFNGDHTLNSEVQKRLTQGSGTALEIMNPHGILSKNRLDFDRPHRDAKETLVSDSFFGSDQDSVPHGETHETDDVDSTSSAPFFTSKNDPVPHEEVHETDEDPPKSPDPFFVPESTPVQDHASETKVDMDAPPSHEKGAEWLRQANDSHKRAEKGNTIKPPESSDQKHTHEALKETRTTMEKWMERVNQLGSAARILSHPDQAMDAMMGATLGKASDHIVNSSKKAVVWFRNGWRDSNAPGKLPKEVKRQTDPASKRGSVKVDFHAPDDTTSWYSEWLKHQKAEAGTEQPSGDPANKNVRSEVPPASRPSAEMGEDQSSSSPSVTRESYPIMRWRRATTTQIRHVKRRSLDRRVQRLTRYTTAKQTTEPKPGRPRLMRKGPSLSDRIFGDRP